MNHFRRQAIGLLAVACVFSVKAQVQWNGAGDYRLHPTAPAAGPRSLTIGPNYSGAGQPALNVRADQFSAGNLTGEVFRTVAPAANNTFWRLYSGGVAAGNERGQLFSNTGSTDFNLNAPNGHFLLHTQNVRRARLNGNLTGPIGPTPALEFPGIVRDGFMMLSGTADAFTNAASRAPFTRLHLVDNAVDPNDPIKYAQQHGFRPWQRNGITFTGNSDQSYIGHRYAGDDNTDFVVQWSDNPNGSPWGTDRMRFVFTTQFNPANTRGATSVDGLEAIRLWPRNHQEVNVGIGDFFAGNQLASTVVVDPTERVDILNGRLRIRDLPSNPAATDSFYVMVVDRTALTPGNQERGVVKWVPPSIFGSGGGADCDWTLGAPGNVMYTASDPIGSTTNCPEADWSVGIGTGQPYYKLDVQHSEDNGDMVGGIRALFEVDDPQQGTAIYAGIGPVSGGVMPVATAVQARVDGVEDRGIGVDAHVHSTTDDGFATRTDGVMGTVYGPTDAGGVLNAASGVTGSVIGVNGGGSIANATAVNADVWATVPMTTVNGVYSWVHGAGASSTRTGLTSDVDGDGATNNCYGATLSATGGNVGNIGLHSEAFGAGAWAGDFIGNVNIDGDIFLFNTYYASDAALKTDVQSVTPSADVIGALQVHSYQFNDQANAMGMPEGEQVGLIAQEVEQVLPGLVTMRDVPARMDATGAVAQEAVSYKAVNYVGLIPYLISAVQKLQADNAEMQEQLAACCASPTDSDQRNGSIGTGAEEEMLTPAQERALRIAPNPFTDRTTLYCNLERAGRMQLMANSADGRDLMVLAEGQRQAGEFQQVWSTENLAPGVYYITLLLNGEPVVKRAVKVGR